MLRGFIFHIFDYSMYLLIFNSFSMKTFSCLISLLCLSFLSVSVNAQVK